jgi:hypothetical protein
MGCTRAAATLAILVLARPAWPEDRPAARSVHAFVALCDNLNQGIVRVPAALGNGQDPARNLYWGARFGLKTFFRHAADWRLVQCAPAPGPVLERCVFRHTASGTHLVADAYDGAAIRAAVSDFLEAASGGLPGVLQLDGGPAKLGGAADLLVYMGHDGLMDFTLERLPAARDARQRETIVLACSSRDFFREPLRSAGAVPLLWTTGLLAPEAYVLEAALAGWIRGEDGEAIRLRAASAYERWQGCGSRAARNLFSSGALH